MNKKETSKPLASKPTTKEFVVTGTTKPLESDKQTRDITLVAIISTETITDTQTRYYRRIEGKRTIAMNVTDQVTIRRRTLRIGMAVASPSDKALTAEYDKAVSIGDKATVERLDHTKQFCRVTAEQGQFIARGKAGKKRSALAIIVCDTGFFTDEIVQLMLKAKLMQITKDPDRFVRTGKPEKRVKPVNLPSKKLLKGSDSIKISTVPTNGQHKPEHVHA